MTNGKILNPKQHESITYGNGPLLIVAGAGTGKTTVITERIKYLVLEKKIPPSQILALTFTEKAAREMEERVDIAMPYGYTQLWIATFHSFCDRILRNEGIHIGLNTSYKLMTEAETVLFLRSNIFKFRLEYFRPLGNPNKFLEGMIQHFSRLSDEDVSPNQYLDWAQNQRSKIPLRSEASKDQKLERELEADKDEIKKTFELANAYKAYQELKIKEGVMDFSDLIFYTLRLFRSRKNILQYYQNQFRHILVDEFQDTNFAQNELAVLLSGERKNITVVGDDDQAIYRWRGAAISNIIQFRKHFPDSKIITLTQNYRSTREILDTSYRLISYNNPDRLEIKEEIDKKLTSSRKVKGDPVKFIFADHVENEAEEVAGKIKELAETQKYTYRDIAILVRANDHAHAFSKTLQRHGIPYQFLGPGKLFHQEEIKDLIAYLKVLYNFEDSVSLYRVLSMSIFDFEPLEIASLLNFSKRKNSTLFETLYQMAYPESDISNLFIGNVAKEKIKTIVDMIKRHLKLAKDTSAGQILYYFLKDSGLLKKLIEGDVAIDEKQSKNIARFFEKLKTFEAEREDARIFPAVEWIDLSMQMGESPLGGDTDWFDNNAVNILTIHSSKGLEFKVVFLVNLVNQRFPTRERKEQIPVPVELIKEILPSGDYHLQEERRLFYVGMTRAKDQLILTAAKYYGEGKRERKLSPFVYEALGEEVVKKMTIKQSNNQTIKQLSLLGWSTPNNQSLITDRPSPITNPITYLSYSQIQTFEICPLHYKLKYIHRIPTQQTVSQSFGTSIHATLRDFYQGAIRKEPILLSSLESILKKNWINEGYTNKTHEQNAFEKARKITTDYLNQNFDMKLVSFKTIAVETPFQFSIRHPKDAASWLKIGGRLDRIDRIDENKIEILDYKTGSNVPSEKELIDNLQLTLYALAAMEVKDQILNKKPENILLSLYYLEEGKKLMTTRTNKQLEEAKIILFEKAQEIAKSDFKCSGSIICQNCEYKMLCSTI